MQNAQVEQTENCLQLKDTGQGKNIWGTVLIIISATAFGLMAIFAKFAYQAQLNMLTILSLRFTIAAAVMWIIVLAKRENPRVERKQLFALLGLGAMGYGLMSTFFFNSVRLIPASIASILLYTYPVLVTALSAVIYKEAVTKLKVLSLIISSAGLIMVVGVAFKGLNFLGLFCGIMAAVVYALYIITSNRYVDKIDPIIVTTYISTAAAIAFNVVGWYKGAINIFIGPIEWLSILGIAVVSSVVAILTFFQGMKIVGPSKASIISTIEPVVTILAAFVLFNEKLSMLQILGAALVIGAVILVQKDK